LAVAGLAASALLLTSGAAYAGDNDFQRHTHFGSGSFGAGSQSSSMSWGFYNGPLTDLSPSTKDPFDGAKAVATMMGIGGRTFFRLQVRGVVDDEAIGKSYGAHLHQGPCGLDTAGLPTVGLHYNTSKFDPVKKVFESITPETEVWLDFKVDAFGNARSTARVDFVPTAGEEARSITLHATPTVTAHHATSTAAVGSAGAKLACLPLEIRTLPESR
jgi:hypothetical protein